MRALSIAIAIIAPLLMGAMVRVGSSGDVSGPGACTDNAIVRFHDVSGKTIQCSTAASIDDSGNATFNSVSTADVDGSNASTLFGNPSCDVTAPTGDDLSLFTCDNGELLVKSPGDGPGVHVLASAAGRAYFQGGLSFSADPVGTTKATLEDRYEDDASGCISRSTNDIVISCNGWYRFRAWAFWSPQAFSGGVYWYRETATQAYLQGSGEIVGCAGAPYEVTYQVTSTPLSFAIYPIPCDGDTHVGSSGELVVDGEGFFVVERVR